MISEFFSQTIFFRIKISVAVQRILSDRNLKRNLHFLQQIDQPRKKLKVLYTKNLKKTNGNFFFFNIFIKFFFSQDSHKKENSGYFCTVSAKNEIKSYLKAIKMKTSHRSCSREPNLSNIFSRINIYRYS